MLKRIGIGLLIVVGVVVVAVIALLVIKPWAPRYVVDEPGPTGVRLTDDGLIANFYGTPRSSLQPGVLLVSGSDGGISTHLTQQAVALQDAGFNVLVLSWLGGPGQPRAIERIPLETFEAGLALLAGLPSVDPERLVLMGGSKGAEAMLLLATTHPEIKAVVAPAPSAVAWQGFDLAEFWRTDLGSSWTRDGVEVPYLPTAKGSDVRSAWDGYSKAWQTVTQQTPSVIPIEKITAPILLQCGEQDSLTPSCAQAQFIVDRAKQFGGAEVTLLTYPDAGHVSYGTPLDPSDPLYDRIDMYGGTSESNVAAMADSWPKIVQFLQDATA